MGVSPRIALSSVLFPDPFVPMIHDRAGLDRQVDVAQPSRSPSPALTSSKTRPALAGTAAHDTQSRLVRCIASTASPLPRAAAGSRRRESRPAARHDRRATCRAGRQLTAAELFSCSVGTAEHRRATVFRTLETLVDAGVVRRLEQMATCTRMSPASPASPPPLLHPLRPRGRDQRGATCVRSRAASPPARLRDRRCTPRLLRRCQQCRAESGRHA